MDAKLVNVDQLTLDEASKIEGDWAQFSDSDLASLSTSLNATAIRDGLENGELALMVDSPSSPLLIRADGNQYFVNKTHAPTLAPNGISRIERRFSGHYGGGGVSPNGSLHPPKPMPPYTPEPVLRNNKDLSPTLEYCFEIVCSEKSFAKNIGCTFTLKGSFDERLIGSWVTAKTEYGFKRGVKPNGTVLYVKR